MTDQNQTPPPTPEQASPPDQAPPPPPEPSKSGSSTILIIGIVVIVLIALGAIFYLIFGRGGSDTANPPPEAAVPTSPAATAPTPPEITLPTPAPGTPLATALTAINFRSGPGTNYPSYGVAPQGAQGVVVGISEDGGWWVVQVNHPDLVPEGQAWVSGEYVRTENTESVPVIPSPEPPPIVEVPPPDPNGSIATALDVINLRSGPGTNYPSYGLAQKGAQGAVIGISEDGRWWVVKLPTSLTNTGQGWVSADWVAVQNAGDVPIIPAP